MRASRIRSIVGLVAAAVVLGVFTLSPVAAHFTTNTKHLGKHAWQQFIKNKVYTKKQADKRFLDEAHQNSNGGNITLSTSAATPTTLNTLALPGPAVYLVHGSASIFNSAAAGTTCNANVTIRRGGTIIGGHNEVGAFRTPANDFDPGTYSAQRLINVPAAGATVTVAAYRQSGAGTCVAFSRLLTALEVDSGVGSFAALAATERGGGTS